MKKILLFGLCAVLCLLAVGCRRAEEKAAVFEAEILEIKDGEMWVKPLEGFPERQYAERIRVPIQHVESSREPVVGDVVEITYNGAMLEEDPPSPCGVSHIKLK